MESVDEKVFFWINGWHSETLDAVFAVISVFGAWPIVLVTLAWVATDGRREFWKRHVPFVVGALGVTFLVNSGLKYAFDAPRPVAVYAAEIAAGDTSIHFLDADPPARRSFPSGHSMTSGLAMMYLWLWRRSLWPFAFVALMLVTMSRVYGGAHFPSDCLAGAFVGVLGGLGGWRLGRTWFERAAKSGMDLVSNSAA